MFVLTLMVVYELLSTILNSNGNTEISVANLDISLDNIQLHIWL